VDVGLSTAAAPTFFATVKRNGYVFADGGIWANNPAMIGVVDAPTSYDIDRTQIRLLSLGCGQESYRMRWWHRIGGKFIWASAFVSSAMRAQSHNALGQAGLLIGRSNLVRLDAPEVSKRISMDNVDRAMAEMPPVAQVLTEASGHRIYQMFLHDEENTLDSNHPS
jgi:patatin-like phospholipase/acyl hydrolase